MSEYVKLNNIIQNKKRNKINTFVKPDGSSTKPGLETLDTLIKTHFPLATEQIQKKYSSENMFSKDYIKSKNDDWINPDLIKEAMALFQDKKSPGPDGIKPVLFKYLTPNLIMH